MFAEETVSRFAETFESYARLRNKTRDEVAAHVANSYSIFLYRSLKDKAEPKGSIEGKLLTHLRSGGGLRISAKAREMADKQNKDGSLGGFALQRVRATQEIKLRESRRMFTAGSSLFRGAKKTAKGVRVFSKKGNTITGGLVVKSDGPEGTQAVFDWNSQIGKWAAVAAVGLKKDSRSSALNEALRLAHADMRVYIERKIKENGRKAARKWTH